VLPFKGTEGYAGIIFLELNGSSSILGVISKKIGGVPLSYYQVNDDGDVIELNGDIECDGYRGVRYFICSGSSSCNGVIFHEGTWCEGTKNCTGS